VGYDIIGDIHGQGDMLEALLKKMGYRHDGQCYRHDSRRAIFVGDFIDRGPQQLKTLGLARPMIDAGAALAVMGNHELNAICWHTPDPDRPGDYLRPRTGSLGEKNRTQHGAFLAEVGEDSPAHADIIRWFKTLPLWLDLPGLRVVHACWHPRYMNWLKANGHVDEHGRLLEDRYPAASREPASREEKDSPGPSVFKAVETVAKGIEVPLPNGESFRDAQGTVRHRARVRWWDGPGGTYRTSALVDRATRKNLPDEKLPAHAWPALPEDKPIFFGHYWLKGRPEIQAPNIACVDYSAARGGDLVAYRWSGESRLSKDKFIQVGPS